MKWETTRTELANRINGGNMFREADIVSAETLNVIFTELFKLSELIEKLERSN
ncbi:MAG: hypothetical protein FWE36_04610 [Erysipelotrichales bacterium]|nr:hypothetical protein [Erysipelotrichales bacterium]